MLKCAIDEGCKDLGSYLFVVPRLCRVMRVCSFGRNGIEGRHYLFVAYLFQHCSDDVVELSSLLSI